MKKGFNILGIVLGVIFIIWGVVMLLFTQNIYVYKTEFGGDYYTYSYEVACETVDLLKLIYVSISAILIALGGFMSCYFGSKFAEEKNNHEKNNSNLKYTNEEVQDYISEEMPKF